MLGIGFRLSNRAHILSSRDSDSEGWESLGGGVFTFLTDNSDTGVRKTLISKILAE